MNNALNSIEKKFVLVWNEISEFHHELMIQKKFWNGRKILRETLNEQPYALEIAENAMDCQLLSLITTEVSEVVEALRKGNPPDDKIPEFCGAAAELADVILRVMDLACGRGWPVAEALVAKIAMNSTREPMHGGKLF